MLLVCILPSSAAFIRPSLPHTLMESRLRQTHQPRQRHPQRLRSTGLRMQTATKMGYAWDISSIKQISDKYQRPDCITSREFDIGKQTFLLYFFPNGSKWSTDGNCALRLVPLGAPPAWKFSLYVGSKKVGPFSFDSDEYWEQSNNICKLPDENLDVSLFEVGIEVV
ncbi:unnamed protein product [Vitrella brassicaformis CCMP3155]|uniref:Uncharacterized protein n=1 Tax=Vitrella brassicaformis (strain CCMP3155) TaxID=1169540 RepID=A0A0G4GSH2_VITBC|nr:unnamed protein product [Vitrella brassicaformis CCMP3155]|eukprot:CEM33563.1 unnamed protein product [Vitrella brassicaformis CCMP3155]